MFASREIRSKNTWRELEHGEIHVLFASVEQISGPSLDSSQIWFAVSGEWFHKPREFIVSNSFLFFIADIAEVYIFEKWPNGGIVIHRGHHGFDLRERDSYFCYSLRNSLKSVTRKEPRWSKLELFYIGEKSDLQKCDCVRRLSVPQIFARRAWVWHYFLNCSWQTLLNFLNIGRNRLQQGEL